ncbi:type ii secretion system protein e : Type II secretion system protein E OS=Planctomyces limnophilus (strain ATCC 43296 / DSM 3776 / IFAM 1008 / 290) GN=Plim_0408 PE=4 SV=1: T2SE_Nter: T2SE [Gemmataceae bacterium]|nr:type ii secretion system protein e : Type II secretion system protein E OS=Planctomyces limnophilus (strain ATCC 43296 / DSM 3776 / IFAM 1008 / 290) GN=Plim_0408 PE=4 SV=1: T2SE_Nter: T2SE [Gemmataceae bacterium]VTU00483.1 type ii secretion system protein e : Type II secretion system protein E OS=Planctomyces limnophilus (strain ATCC 43296 / DSM 3776 / IFAM 1008 / 290) GN=Plim_0408 PE=4 SV=1: T2SE_Nter: T2SE [Gemmataceae bacterium]
MSSIPPNDKNLPPKKPAAPGASSGQPPKPAGGTPAGVPKPAPPAAPGAKPATPPAAGAKPAQPAAGGAKPPVPPAAKTPAGGSPKPAPAKKPTKARHTHIDSNTRQLGQKLVDLGHLDEAQLEALYEDMRNLDDRLSELVVQRKLVTEDQLLAATAEVFGMRVGNLEDARPQPDAVKLVTQQMADLYKVVPLSLENDVLTVALADPNNLQALDDLKNLLGIRNVSAVLAPPAQVEALLNRAYSGGKEESITNLISELEASGAGNENYGRENSIDLDGAMEMANSAPVRKLINMVLLMAIRDHASDVHFEPFEEEYKMRYRCDGVLYEMVPPPRHLATAIASRIKVMANLDIAERRLPQDGRIELNVGGNPVDMRVSVLPTLFGESVVIRVLDRTNVGLSLDRIGMPPDILGQFRACIKKPNGIVLVTGPTGSGKTTTLYSALSELNDIDTKIITTEDPVEYEIDGIVQCPINHEIDVTFASALRAILRQDPDVILVGEIRDLETAQIAIQASLTGHMVFSTLHTNDAPSSVTRLRDMGVEPFLITATVEAIQAQRLVRRVCQNCRAGYDPTREQMMELNLTPDVVKGRQFFYGEGCDKCNNLGFKGRTGLYELLIMNDDLRDMVSTGVSTDAIRAYCRKIGTASLRDSGLRALYAGTTTLDEVVRETVLEDEA